MRLLEDIDELLGLVGDGKFRALDAAAHARLSDLDAQISGRCSLLGLARPEYEMAGHMQAFGFTRVPYERSSEGPSVVAAWQWRQAMMGLRAAAVIAATEQHIGADDLGVARTLRAIAEYAEKVFKHRPNEESVRRWIDDGSLRARKRGQLWEFSKADLAALVDTSPGKRAARRRRRMSGTD